MFKSSCIVMVLSEISFGLEIPLPFNQRLSYNAETGVLRIGLKPKLSVPPYGTPVDPSILSSIQVRHSGNDVKGFGAFAISDIEKDVFIGFYEGKKILSRESLESIIFERRKETDQNPDSAMGYVMNVDGGFTFIDGYERAQDRTVFSTVHLNHADKESQGCNVIRLLEDERIAFFTSRSVHAGEELCFDYGSNFWKEKELLKV